MLNAFFLSDALGGAERGGRRLWCVEKTVAGEETREVKWGIGQLVVDEPTAHLADHVHIIVDIRDDKVGDLDPHASLLHGEDGVEDGLQMAAADTMVDIVAEGFEVDIGGIEVGQEVF